MNVHIRHAFRDFPEYPALVDASNAVTTASIGCKCCDEGPDLLCVAELDGVPVASVHFSYDWDSRSWSVGDVAFKAPLSDKVISDLPKHVFWCTYRNPHPPAGRPPGHRGGGAPHGKCVLPRGRGVPDHKGRAGQG